MLSEDLGVDDRFFHAKLPCASTSAYSWSRAVANVGSLRWGRGPRRIFCQGSFIKSHRPMSCAYRLLSP